MPDLVRFRDRLQEALDEGRRRGMLGEPELDALLLDPDFDAAEFERFRSAATHAGVRLPDEDLERAPEPIGAPCEPERDLLDLYLREIGRVPLLTHEELLAVSRRSRRGDDDARKRIILANLRLVVHVSRRYRN